MIFSGAKVFLEDHFETADLHIIDGIISRIAAEHTLSPESGEDFFDCTGLKIIPGLVDIHTHGCLGFDFSLSDAEEGLKMCKFYAEHGVTSILATTMTGELSGYRIACARIRELIRLTSEKIDVPSPCARVHGINMEGPFLSFEKRGAHDPQYLYPVSEELFDELDSLSGNSIRLITIAPELEGALDFIHSHSHAKNRRYLSLGHSACDYALAVKAFNEGADHVTHLYNAMNGLSHRNPGIPGAAADCGAFVELICDGLHVHEAVIRHTFKANPDHVVLISDSINPTGLPDGKYSAGGLPVYMSEGEIRLKDGTLAGSSITLFDALSRCVNRFGIPEETAIKAATLNPALSVGLENKCGRIREGMPAEIVVIDDLYNIKRVIC